MSAAHQDLPMMPGESLDSAFGEKRGLDADASREKNSLLLTDRRVIRLSRTNRGVTTTFHSLEDVQSAEVHHRPRGKRRLFRMALLLAGAGAALIAVDSAPVAQALAAILGLGALYHLYQFISVSREGTIRFQATQQELVLPYRGPAAEQAYTLVNRFFHLKSDLSNAADTVSDGRYEAERKEQPGKPFSRRQQRGRSIWYEVWFLDRLMSPSQLRPPSGAGSSRAVQESETEPSQNGYDVSPSSEVEEAEETDSQQSEPVPGD